MNLEQLQQVYVRAGARKLYVKRLASNDNSKQQVYFGPDFSALNIFPTKGIRAEGMGPNEKPRFKAALDFSWLQENGRLVKAPDAQLILYPQYPEVRFSGFLRGAEGAPNDTMTSREAGRVLFLAVTSSGSVIGHVTHAQSALAREVAAIPSPLAVGVFLDLPLTLATAVDPRDAILTVLRTVHAKGWIASKRLRADGVIGPCEASNCGGYTLEAELGITPNGFAEPDYQGWEVKSFAVSDFSRLTSKAVTLMTPEPTAGVYGSEGAAAFVRRFGYADGKGRSGRMNFSSPHRAGTRNARTKLRLELRGFDAVKGKITDASGGMDLLADDGTCAASWPFAGLMEHWGRKHALAAYVPTIGRIEPLRQYSYGYLIRLGLGTDFQRLLSAIAAGVAYYDPGIKLVRGNDGQEQTKRRSQFRIPAKALSTLYATFEEHNVGA